MSNLHVIILPESKRTGERLHAYLPPASEGWGRYCFHKCVCWGGGGTTWSLFLGAFSGLRSFRGWGGGCQSLSLLLSGGYPNLGQGYPTPSQARDSPLSRTGRWLERLTANATRSLCPLCNGTGESQTEQEWCSTPSWCGLSCPCPSLGPGEGALSNDAERRLPPPPWTNTQNWKYYLPQPSDANFKNVNGKLLLISMEQSNQNHKMV